ncbi:MAG: PASTA domain-containing protein [Bacteroidetes bacterium]|nr:PASTA domain-containing protein [Bacteroidota bacterium]
MHSFFSFLKSKQFFINLAVIVLLIVSMFVGIMMWTSTYTQHNDFVEVPDFKHKNTAEIENFVSGKGVACQIIDSIYDPKQKPGIVLRQDPEAGAKVKHNRTVYLYVTCMVAPQILMPKLIDRSERQAKLIISSYGLKVGNTSLAAADCNGCVVAQLINGKNIEPGESVKKGSTVNLVIGKKGLRAKEDEEEHDENEHD